ncbi:Centromere protein H, partial [Galemys pyrenaicus]
SMLDATKEKTPGQIMQEKQIKDLEDETENNFGNGNTCIRQEATFHCTLKKIGEKIHTDKNNQKDDLDSMENSDKIKTIQQSLQMEIQITTVFQRVFQNLILGSKANWAEDSALKEISAT